MDLGISTDLLHLQCGVVTREQLKARGAGDGDLQRWIRRRALVRVHPRVYATHTGPLTWEQQAWAAVLWAGRAALSHQSAVRIALPSRHETAAREGPIHVVIPESRRLDEVAGVRVHRTRDFDNRVVHLSPPRVRLEHALLDLAEGARTDLDAVAVLADACGARRTTPARLLEHLAQRSRVARRQRVEAILRDAVHGTCSALEHAFLELLRRHGLPIGERQVSHRHPGDRRYMDVLLAGLLLCVELDGRLVHGSAAARDRDLDRDLDAVVDDDLLTVRLGWGQTVDRGCQTAAKLERLCTKRGWAGQAHPCPDCASTWPGR